jgi:MbtH protein
MSIETESTGDVFDVVRNDEGQYSIWPVYKSLPSGWTTVGKRGEKDACLTYINEVLTDMRPLSLKQKMER